jgi:hypothetical protein
MSILREYLQGPSTEESSTVSDERDTTTDDERRKDTKADEMKADTRADETTDTRISVRSGPDNEPSRENAQSCMNQDCSRE